MNHLWISAISLHLTCHSDQSHNLTEKVNLSELALCLRQLRHLLHFLFSDIIFLLESIQMEPTVHLTLVWRISLLPLSEKCPLNCGYFKRGLTLWGRQGNLPFSLEATLHHLCKSYLQWPINQEDGRRHHRDITIVQTTRTPDTCVTQELCKINTNTNKKENWPWGGNKIINKIKFFSLKNKEITLNNSNPLRNLRTCISKL